MTRTRRSPRPCTICSPPRRSCHPTKRSPGRDAARSARRDASRSRRPPSSSRARRSASRRDATSRSAIFSSSSRARGSARVRRRSGARPRSRPRTSRAASTTRSGSRARRCAMASVFVIAQVDRVLLGLLEEALAALPAEDSPLRARLLARLGAALQPAARSGAPDHARPRGDRDGATRGGRADAARGARRRNVGACCSSAIRASVCRSTRSSSRSRRAPAIAWPCFAGSCGSSSITSSWEIPRAPTARSRSTTPSRARSICPRSAGARRSCARCAP